MHFLILVFSGLLTFMGVEPTAPNEGNPTLVWAEEFDYSGLPDKANWTYDVGNGCDLPCGCGWGNQELQYYSEARPENARVENGHLIIEAHQEQIETNQYSSARIATRTKGSWKYGKLEIRAKLPMGKGTWPAIWMLPTENQYGGWPKSGEIDIMEHVGHVPDSIYGTVHTGAFNWLKGTHRGGAAELDDLADEFHTYGIDWDESKIDFFVDDRVYMSFQNENSGEEAWPFDQPFYLILNLAVGGILGGKEGVGEDIWPQQMLVDYIRVYQ